MQEQDNTHDSFLEAQGALDDPRHWLANTIPKSEGGHLPCIGGTNSIALRFFREISSTHGIGSGRSWGLSAAVLSWMRYPFSTELDKDAWL